MITLAVFGALACFAVIAWLRFPVALGLFAFTLPSYQIRFQIFGVPTTLLELFFFVLFCVWLVRRRRSFGFTRQAPLLLPALLLLLTAVVSMIISPDRHAGLGALKAYFLEPILFFLIAFGELRSRQAVRWMLIGLGSIALIAGCVAALQYAHIVPSPAPWDLESPRRVVGIFAYPNALGLFLSPIAALFLAVLLFGGFSRHFRSFAGTVLAACVLGIAFSVSRGAVLAVLASFLTLTLFHRFRLWLLAGLGAAIIVAFLIPATRTALVSVATGRDVSTDVRSVLWQGTVRLLQDRPLQGAGLGGFPIVYNEYRLAQHRELLLYPHNILFNFWVELGLAGVIVMAWIFGDVLSFAIRRARAATEPFARTVTLGGLATFIGMLAYGLVDVPYLKNDLAMLFWLLVALVFAAPLLVSAKTGQKS